MEKLLAIAGLGLLAFLMVKPEQPQGDDGFVQDDDASSRLAVGDDLYYFEPDLYGFDGQIDGWINDILDFPDITIDTGENWINETDPMGNYTGASWADDMQTWSPSRIPALYINAIRTAETKYAIPHDMLARLLWQESRYRADIISGATKSAVGALGIAQFMPATAAEMKINPLDPFQAIDAAGRYLKKLYGSTGTWAQALAAYNWGIGNVLKKGLALAPSETRNYYTSILADIGMSPTMA